MSKETVLEVDKLTKVFGSLRAVDEISWEVERGQTKAIIGPNGAGKSTFFNLVTGVLPVTSGQVYLRGEDVTGKAEYKIVRRGLVKTYQQTNIYTDVSVFENIRIASQMKTSTFNLWGKADNLTDVNDQTTKILSRIGLLDEQDRQAGDLAHGQQRKIEIGIALALKPDIILLDEPIAGMSEDGKREVLELLHELSNDPELTTVITEHDIDVIMDLADQITVLHQGQVLTEGLPDEIIEDDRVQDVYLGGANAA